MSKRPAPSTFTYNYYRGKPQDHAQYLAIVERQSEVFRLIGEAVVKLFRRRYLDKDDPIKEPLANHAWFGRHEHAEEAGLPQMDELLDAVFAEHPDLYEDMVDLQFQMSAPKDKANWMSGRMKDPVEMSNTDYWFKIDLATNCQLPTINNLKRLSIYCGTDAAHRSYLNALKSHGIKVGWRPKLSVVGSAIVGHHCSLLPGLNYNGDGKSDALPASFDDMQEAFPCSTPSVHFDSTGKLRIGTLQAPCAFIGTIPGLYPQGGGGEGREDCLWGVFYHGNSGLFMAPTHTNDLHLPYLGHREGEGYNDKHLTGVMTINTTTEGWNNLLAPTLTMSLNTGDEDSWTNSNTAGMATKAVETTLREKDYWEGLTRAVGATVFFRMASDRTLLSPALYAKQAIGDGEYIHPALTHAGSPMATETDAFEEAEAKVRFVNSWADKRPELTLTQGDGRYYHNIVRCSVCNGRVKVTLGRTPKPVSPLKCPHCARPGIEIDTIHWTVKA